MHIFCPHIYYFYKNLFTIVASGCLIITHVLTIFPCAPPFSLHYMDYSMLRASRSSCVCGNYVKFKTVSGKRERERNRVRHKSSETWSDRTKAGHIKRKTKGRTFFQSCQSYQAVLQPPQWQRDRRRIKSSRQRRLLSRYCSFHSKWLWLSQQRC